MAQDQQYQLPVEIDPLIGLTSFPHYKGDHLLNLEGFFRGVFVDLCVDAAATLVACSSASLGGRLELFLSLRPDSLFMI